ncbi:acyl-CoA dehydrogenase family protein, partial [Mycobacterium kansasii]
MRRTVYTADHEAFRETLRAFIEAEVVPHYDEWYANGIVPKD